jgi:hypothetical protein
MSTEKSTRSSVYFPPGLYGILQEIAASQDRSVSWLLSRLAADYIYKHYPKHAKKLAQ